MPASLQLLHNTLHWFMCMPPMVTTVWLCSHAHIPRSVDLLLLQSASKPNFLAGLCNSISTGGSVCQAFNFQADTNIGWFKGGTGHLLDLGKTCRSPNITTWILNAGMLCL